MLRSLFLAVSVALSIPAAVAQTYAPRTFMTNAGTYSATVTYAVSDVVQSGSLFYVSIVAGNVGHPVTDTTHWQSLNNGSYSINGKTVTTGGSITLAPADVGADPAGAATTAQQAATAAQTAAQQAQTTAQAAQTTAATAQAAASGAATTATSAATSAQQALAMAQAAQQALANGVATTPPTLFPICGAGAGTGVANQTTVCSKDPKISLSIGADPTSFAYVPLVCDAVETPVLTGFRGQYMYSTSTGTDSTAILALAVGSSNINLSLGAANPVGASAELEAHTTFRRRLVLPDGCNYRVSTWPALTGTDGLKIAGNRTSGYITSTSGNGPVFASMDTGNTSGTSNNSIEEARFVYTGGLPGTSTGNCAGFIGGGHNQMHHVSCFGFNLGIVDAGNEYSDFSDSYTAWNNVGVANLPATFSTFSGTAQIPAAIAGYGTPALDNQFTGITSVQNRVTNWLFNGSNTNTMRGGSSSRGGMADVVFGAIDSPFIDTITIAGASNAVCPTSTTGSLVPLTFAGGSPTMPASAALQVSASGSIVGALLSDGVTAMVDGSGNLIIPTSNGGKGFTSAPSVTAPACTGQFTLTAHVQTWTGILPFSGDASGDGVNLTGAGQNIFEEMDMENEGSNSVGLNRNTSGFQVLEDVSANTNTFKNNTIGIGGSYGYERVFRDEGLGNRHLDTNVSALTHPVTGATCIGIATQDGEVSALSAVVDPENQICSANDTVNTASRFEGWDGAYKKLRGISIANNGATVQLTTTASTALGGVFGIPAGGGYISPAPTMVGNLYGVPEDTGTFLSTNSNPPLTTTITGDGVAGSNVIGIANVGPPYVVVANSILSGPGVQTGTRIKSSAGGKMTLTLPLTATNSGATYSAFPVGQIGSSGIPLGSVCSYARQWGGGGSDPTTWAFFGTATCGNQGAFASYTSAAIMGQEKWSIVGTTQNVTVGNSTLHIVGGIVVNVSTP